MRVIKDRRCYSKILDEVLQTWKNDNGKDKGNVETNKSVQQTCPAFFVQHSCSGAMADLVAGSRKFTPPTV